MLQTQPLLETAVVRRSTYLVTLIVFFVIHWEIGLLGPTVQYVILFDVPHSLKTQRVSSMLSLNPQRSVLGVVEASAQRCSVIENKTEYILLMDALDRCLYNESKSLVTITQDS